MDILYWDLILLVLFVTFVSIFLYKNRKKVSKEGILLLYHTTWGIKLIEKIGKKYPRLLKYSSYFSVALGYVLMILVVYFFVQTVLLYVIRQDLVSQIKLPPIAPIFPYFDRLVPNLGLPNFNFFHWIIVLGIVAIVHEVFHGIYARRANIKVNSTGFGFFPRFLPLIPVAFVNPDEKEMQRASNFDQRAVLSAGTFANVLTAIVGAVIMMLIFPLIFSPVGVVPNDFAYNVVDISQITSINGVLITNQTIDEMVNLTHSGKNKIVAGNETYYGIKGFYEAKVALYYDAPAIKNNFTGAITKIGEEKITSLESLKEATSNLRAGEIVNITTYNGEKETIDTIKLTESPDGEPWIGVVFFDAGSGNIIATIVQGLTSFKEPHIYYESNSELLQYIYDLFWWLVLISFSVALINMLPVGIFDGGRFFYLTVLAITKNKKVAENSFKYITYFFLFLILVLMIFWAKSLF